MDPHTAEDGELEDGEICDDETEQRAPPRRDDGYRPGRGAHLRAHKRHQRPRGGPPLLGPPPPDFPFPMPYSRGPHGPFPLSHRQQCGPSGPDRPPAASPQGPLLPAELGPHGEPSPRSSFWERSHGALGRFRHRVLPNGGRGGWSRGGRGGNNRNPPGRYGPGEMHDSPARKPKPPGRTRSRKGVHSVPRPESVDESFEDLLSKYKQIQLELECIRKEETMALAPTAAPVVEEAATGLEDAALGPESGPEPTASLTEMESVERKVFQAFNIKPLRQKLPTPAQLDQLHRKWVGPQEGGGPEADGEEPVGEESEERCALCGEPITAAGAGVSDQNLQCSCRPSGPSSSGVTTRSAAAAERRRTRSTPADQDLNKTAAGDGPKPGPKASSSAKGATSPGVPPTAAGPAESEARSEVCTEVTDQAGVSSPSSEDSNPADRPLQKVEEDEMSELQLRLLALQSASKKWQQKEQQVMKRSKDRITRAPQDRSSAPSTGSGAPPPNRPRVTTRSASSAAAAAAERSRTRSKAADRDRTKTTTRPPDRDRDRPKPGAKGLLERGRTPVKSHLPKVTFSSHHQTPGSVVKQAFRKQQLRTWKLQQQREQEEKRRQQEEKRRQEEEERRKREEEIRRIRDLSNQDEQYNRFMKLVGGHRKPRSKSRDGDHRKSSGRGGLDSSGNLYQYDNYEEVAMDTDSETGSPVPSPSHMLTMEDPGRPPSMAAYGPDTFEMDFYQSFLPPPPPPLPPPPDELEPPPKPPFADEEEEEEMLLRETCLMSMAHKRVANTETSSSGPPSPSGAPPADLQLPPRGNLSTVSLNTVPPAHRKFSRGHHASRAPLVLPRHKAVVVSLNDSDDSDSDGDAGSCSQAVFGGLEFMIKEARRTVEAAKPKAASGCEKENNPLRSAEVPPEAKKKEFHLKEEISREKPRTPRDSSLVPAPEPESQTVVDSTLRAAAELKVFETQQRLSAFRDVLQKDEVVLRHLLQQVLKKTESLKASEAKVSRLREQLQASEKIANANRTLLRKLQEQVRRVEQRISMKRSMVLRLENDVFDAQQHVGRGTKRRADSQPVQRKLQRVAPPPGHSERHFAELIAHKQRLQQLESQYALKIQRLKAAQALRNKGGAVEPPPAVPEAPLPAPPPPGPAAPPQPSLHDLTQDKLVLDNEDVPEPEDAESTAARRSSRRRSSGSFTKPHLDAPSSTPAKEGGAKPGQLPVDTWTGLDIDTLRQKYQQRAPLRELLLTELLKMQSRDDTPPAGEVLNIKWDVSTLAAVPLQVVALELEAASSQSASSEQRPAPFGAYHSPLLVFRSYRFSPYYRTKEKFPLSSVTFSNSIDVNKRFCRFDLTGTCNHDGCSWQHMRDIALTGNQLFEDILSYSLPLIGCSESNSDVDISTATESYMKKLFGTNRDRMGVDQKAVLLVSKVNESQRHVPPFTTCKDPRKWRPRSRASKAAVPEEDGGDEAIHLMPGRADELGVSVLCEAVDACVTSEDRRYFLSETDDVWNLESSVSESPGDTQLWIKLAFKYLSQSHCPAEENLEAALNTLSRALESNTEDPEVWTHYLTLFSRRGSREEVQEMCELAVEHAPDHRVWWKYLTLETSFEGKDSVCERLLSFLITEASSKASKKLSFHLMEALLYRVQLSVFSGREEHAVSLLQSALEAEQEVGVAARLTPADRALLWLSYIHLLEFRRLPSDLYDPTESGPSRLLRPRSFLLPWRAPEDVRTPLDCLLTLFNDGVHRCSEESASESTRMQACMPLHLNLIHLYRLLHRFEEGVFQCESLLRVCPDSCTVRRALAELHMCSGEAVLAVSVWLTALQACPHNAEVFYHCCCFLMAQGKSDSVLPLFREFILSLCDEEKQCNPTDILRLLLSFSSEESFRGSIIKKEVQQQLSQQTSFLHLIHCRWHWLTSSVEQTVEAFELALGSTLQLEELHTLWMDYLLFSCGPRARHAAASAAAHCRTICDLLHRCLSTVPSRLNVPFNHTQFFNCYRFHNQVVSFYLSLLPQSQHALLLERLHSAMPNNTELGLSFLLQLHDDGLMEQLRFQTRLLSSSSPRCLALWKILLAVQVELKQQVEVRLVYQQALQHLPLCADLWKHRMLFEAAVGGASERLRRMLEACVEAGVSVRPSEGF